MSGRFRRRVLSGTALMALAFLLSGCGLLGLIVGETVPNVQRRAFEPLGAFRIVDPYDVAGNWYKAQLHVHTAASLDSTWSVDSALRSYAASGYDFVAITDHDAVTDPRRTPAGLVVIRAEEHTLSFPMWPLGQHAVFLFVSDHVDCRSAAECFDTVRGAGGLVSIAHPNWVGNLGNGRWDDWQLLAAPGFTLMEVFNPHSDFREDTATWHDALVRRGARNPVWAVAVDDAHDEKHVDRGWTMVKAVGKSSAALREALRQGSVYATTGVDAEFGVERGEIYVKVDYPSEITFINASGRVVHASSYASTARYTPSGSDGFVRVEVKSRKGRAWSQPFWLVPA